MKKLPRCLLTGATGGIGSAIAHEMASRGYSLVLHGRNESKLIELCHQLPCVEGSEPHQIVIGDILKAEDRAEMLNRAFTSSSVSILINNAGVSSFNDFSHVSAEQINQVLNTNLVATIQLTYDFLKIKNFNQATVVNVGSALGAIGFPGYSLYCASKFGLRGFTESLTRELVNNDVRVCYLASRATDTKINSDNVLAMNKAMGSKVDPPEKVAEALISLLEGKGNRKSVGWPEKLFARINGLFPELVDSSFKKSLTTILKFTQGEQS
jgi:short-subunit dehydrogenase